MAKFRVPPQIALGFVKSLRPIIDISDGYNGRHVSPINFLAQHQEKIWEIFPTEGIPHWTLPATVTPNVFLAMCGTDWSTVPEYARAYSQAQEAASGQGSRVSGPSAQQWLNDPGWRQGQAALASSSTQVADRGLAPTGSADGDGIGPAAAAAANIVSDKKGIDVVADIDGTSKKSKKK